MMELLILFGILFAVTTAKADEPDDDVGSEPVDKPSSGGLARIRELGARFGLPEDAIAFLQVIAQRESGGNVNVGLGPNDHPGRPNFLKDSRASRRLQDNEASAARKAYNRMSGEGTQFPGPKANWTFGSVGWFGNLVPYARRHIKLEDPWDLGRESGSFAEGVGNLRGLLGRSSAKTWSHVYAGWGGPSRMSSETKVNARKDSFIERLRKLGLDQTIADRKPPRKNDLKSGKDIYQELKGEANA